MEYHISKCCNAEVFFKGNNMGFWCSKCKKEITNTIVGTTKKEIKELKRIALKTYNLNNPSQA